MGMNIESDIQKQLDALPRIGLPKLRAKEEVSNETSSFPPPIAATAGEVDRALTSLLAHADDIVRQLEAFEMRLVGTVSARPNPEPPPEPVGVFNRFAYDIVGIDRVLAEIDERVKRLHSVLE